MTLQHFDEMEVRRVLIAACRRFAPGGNGALLFARRHHLSEAHVLQAMVGNHAPSDKLCKALGFAKVTRYVREGA